MAEENLKDSPDSGCRRGSVATFEHTSVSKEAVMTNHSMVSGKAFSTIA